MYCDTKCFQVFPEFKQIKDKCTIPDVDCIYQDCPTSYLITSADGSFNEFYLLVDGNQLLDNAFYAKMAQAIAERLPDKKDILVHIHH